MHTPTSRGTPDRLLRQPLIQIHGTEFGDHMVPVLDLQRYALAYSRVWLQGRRIHNRDTRWEIQIGRRGINKTLHHAARREHVQSILALGALLTDAILLTSEPNRDPLAQRNIPWVHTLSASLAVGSTAYQIRLIVKETNVGFRFYDHDLTMDPAQTHEPAGGLPVAHLPKEGATGTPAAGSYMKIELSRNRGKGPTSQHW